MNIHAHNVEYVSSFGSEDHISLTLSEKDGNGVTLYFKSNAELKEVADALAALVSKLEQGEVA